jgi:hypothetical protein
MKCGLHVEGRSIPCKSLSTLALDAEGCEKRVDTNRKTEGRSSGAKARDDSAGFMRGLPPPASLRIEFFRSL